MRTFRFGLYAVAALTVVGAAIPDHTGNSSARPSLISRAPGRVTGTQTTLFLHRKAAMLMGMRRFLVRPAGG